MSKMSHFDFSEDDYDDDDDDMYFFDNPPTTRPKEPAAVNAKVADPGSKYATGLITDVKTSASDADLVLLTTDCVLSKKWIARRLNDFYDILAEIKTTAKSAGVPQPQETATSAAKSVNNKSSNAYEARLFKKIQEMIYKRLEKSLVETLQSFAQPHWLVLLLVENCRDYKSSKYNSLPCLIVKTFESWLAKRPAVKSSPLDDEIRRAAFELATRHHLTLVETVARCYQLTERNEFLLDRLKQKLPLLDYKDKAILIGSLMMHDHFDTEEILMPLLLQDKHNVIEKYLSKSPTQQVKFVQHVEKLCSQDVSVLSYMDRFPKLGSVSIDKLSRKNLSKLAARFIRAYQIDPEVCPSIITDRYYKNLKYLVYRRYVENSINYDPWQELVLECLQNATNLQETFLELLISHNDTRELRKWIQILELPIDSLPAYIQSAASSQNTGDDDDVEWVKEPHRADANFHSLKLDESRIKFVDDRAQFVQFLDEVASGKPTVLPSDHLFVGIDAEWKPTCASGLTGDTESVSNLALIQIATQEAIYLLDIVKLRKIIDSELSQEFGKKFLFNKKIIKVGYGFSQDIKMIGCLLVGNQDNDALRQTVLDLGYLANQMATLNANIFKSASNPVSSLSTEKGLSELVRLCLGKPLNKSEQVSNWEKRPLRKSQIMYAALDAYCLVEIFDFFVQRTKELHLEVDMLKMVGKKFKTSILSAQILSSYQADQADQPATSANTSKDDKSQTNAEPSIPIVNEEPIKPDELKIICDNMLGGLGKELRRCGIDTLILENEKEHNECARIARRENRYALTCGMPYMSMRTQLPEGKCINVITGNAREQCTHVLKVLNCQVNVNDLFSRCRTCNFKGYILLNKNQVKALWFKYKSSESRPQMEVEKSAGKRCKLTAKPDSQYSLQDDQELARKINTDNFTLVSNPEVFVKLEYLFDTTIEVVDLYFVCEGCGHIYWEGPHWQNITKRFSHVLIKD